MQNDERHQYHKFTEKEIEIARSTDLPDLLTSLGYEVKKIGSYHTTKEMDSLRIKNRQTWFRYSEGIGGDAITFVQHFCNKSFSEAVKYLVAWNGHARDSPTTAIQKSKTVSQKRIPFALPEANRDHRRVFAYLRKRGIAPSVIYGFLHAGFLYEDSKYHNCIFVGRDQAGKPVFANQRGTYDLDGVSFKGDVSGSDKDTAFRLRCDGTISTVFVFEAPIDLMSYCSLHREITSNAVALCSLYDGPLRTYLRENPHLRRIVLCLDADEPGQQAAQRLSEQFSKEGYQVDSILPPSGKDWNAYLQQRCDFQERRRCQPKERA